MKNTLIILAVVVLLLGISVTTYTCNQMKENVTDKAFIRYEEYQEIYNTCQKLNTDLCNLKDIPESDRMFEQFSKSQRTIGIKNTLNRWIEEYNAKSKMWNRALWKSKQLPYQLQTTDFNCY